MKDSLRSDPRYKSVKHEDRETLFNEYLSELKAAEQEVARIAKAKHDEEVSSFPTNTTLPFYKNNSSLFPIFGTFFFFV